MIVDKILKQGVHCDQRNGLPVLYRINIANICYTNSLPQIIPAATPAFSDSAPPNLGIVIL